MASLLKCAASRRLTTPLFFLRAANNFSSQSRDPPSNLNIRSSEKRRGMFDQTQKTNSSAQLNPDSDIAWKFLKAKDEQRLCAQIVCAPISGGQQKLGVELGPKALLEHGLPEQLQALGWNLNVHSGNDIEAMGESREYAQDEADRFGVLRRPRFVGTASKILYERLLALPKDEFVLTIGGDHSIGAATVSAAAIKYGKNGGKLNNGHVNGNLNGETGNDNDGICVIWVDAHADINTSATSGSGNIHGCPVAFFLGLQEQVSTVPGFEWAHGCLSRDRLVYIGLRDLDEPEKKILRSLGIKCFTMHEVDKYGIGRVVELALDHVNPNRNRPIHVSFDIDALDPSVAPSTGTPVRGGLTFREGHYICEAVCETGLLVSMDLVEVNPRLAPAEESKQTVQVGCSIIRAAMGETLL